MIKQIDKGLQGLAKLLYELKLRETYIIENLEPKALNKKREEYREELANSIGELERKKFVTPELFSTEDSKKLESLKRAFKDVYHTVFTSQYTEELTMIENAIISLDKAGKESTKLLEYYERTNKVT